jgi:hemerythrin-like domain-containing protein
MNAIALLKAQHREIEELFAKLDGTSAASSRRGLHQGSASRGKDSIAEKILRSLTIHIAIEEQVFYPAVRRLVLREGETVLESLEEHNLVKWELASIAMMDSKNERFQAKTKVLRDLVMHHLEHEEQVLFPAVQKALGAAKLSLIGDELEKAREAMTAGRGRPQGKAAARAETGVGAKRRMMVRGQRSRPTATTSSSPRGRRAGSRASKGARLSSAE